MPNLSFGNTEDTCQGLRSSMDQAVFLLPNPSTNSGGNNRKGNHNMTKYYRRGIVAGALALLPVGAFTLTTQAQSVPLYHMGSHGPQVAVYQQELQDLGYHPGGISGTYSNQTRLAVRNFQHIHRIAVDGIIGPITEHSLVENLRADFVPVNGALGTRFLKFLEYGPAVVALQQDLTRLGYYHGAPDGVFNDFTVAAVRAFQQKHGLPASGIATLLTIKTIHAALNPAKSTAGSGTAPAGGKGGTSGSTTPATTGSTGTTTAPSGSGSPGTASTAAQPLVLGYYVPGQAAWSDLVAHASQINAIAPFWYSFRPNDSLHNMGPNEAFVTSWAHAHGIQVYPMVINGYGNDHMLQNPSLLKSDVATLVSLAKQDHYDGFNIDFESLNNVDEAGLDTFVADLAAGLHQEGKKLIVSVGPRTSNSNGYHVYNYQSLGASADYVDLMLYDAHDNGGPSGPVAPLTWTANITQYAEATIPHAKILVGLAGYGYNWASTGSTEISAVEGINLANQYGYTWVGGNIQEPEVTYSVNGVQHTVWFEDSYSEAMKVAWVGQAHLGGVALWDLGEENAGVWPMLKADLK